MKPFSLVIACHNEAEMLPFSLRPLRSLEDAEIIFVLDRCNDDTERIIEWFRQNVSFPVKVFWKDKNMGFHKQPAMDSFLFGSEHASYERIAWLGADMVVNPTVLDTIRNFHVTPFKFKMIIGSSHLKRMYKLFLSKFAPSYALEVYSKQDLELFEHYPNIPENKEETLWILASRELEKYIKISLPILHIREMNDNMPFFDGFKRAFQNMSLTRTLLHSVLFNRMKVFAGYLYYKLHVKKAHK